MNKEIIEILIKYKQDHLIKYYDHLSASNKIKFLSDISKIDFEKTTKLYNNCSDYETENSNITPIVPFDSSNIENKEFYEQIGNEIISNGQLAVVTMAGGQGTRLGINGPKGVYELDIDGEKISIFEILSKNFINTNVLWVIMTSVDNHQDTIDFFEKNNNFGVKSVIFFKQNMLPMVCVDGKIIVDENGFIKFGADGHGGVFKALHENKIIDLLEKQGVKYLFFCGVDNILVNPLDPVFLGLTDRKQVELSSKSIVKSNPFEAVGVFCYKDNKPHVEEYINISDQMRMAKDSSGEYIYNLSHILSNLIHINLVKQITTKPLPYYRAKKKCTYMDENFKVITPGVENAYKYEQFNFDIFKYANDILVYKVKREDEFAPIKNKDTQKEDCPKTAIKLYIDKKRKSDSVHN